MLGEELLLSLEYPCPGPAEWHAQSPTSRTTDRRPGDREHASAHGSRHCELPGLCHLAEHGGPSDEVMGENRAQKPRHVSR